MTEETTFAKTYEGILPVCGCFDPLDDQGEIPDHGIQILSMVSMVGEAVGQAIIQSGACGVSAPVVLGLIVSAVATEMSIARERMLDRPPLATNLTEEYERLLRGVVDLIPLEIERCRAQTLEFDRTHGVSGSC